MKNQTASTDNKVRYTKLLQACGVNSSADLARNKPECLLRWMEEVNAEKRIVKQLPSREMIIDLVSSAKMLSL
jgi:hypothetical protein